MARFMRYYFLSLEGKGDNRRRQAPPRLPLSKYGVFDHEMSPMGRQ
ncbi:MAG: hypothetical protein WCI95_04955 [bacterium]